MKVEAGILHQQISLRAGRRREPALVVLPGLTLDNKTHSRRVARSMARASAGSLTSTRCPSSSAHAACPDVRRSRTGAGTSARADGVS